MEKKKIFFLTGFVTKFFKISVKDNIYSWIITIILPMKSIINPLVLLSARLKKSLRTKEEQRSRSK